MAAKAKKIGLPPKAHAEAVSSANRRRPFFLAVLLIGLALFVVLMPPGTRDSLWTAIKVQRGLVILLTVFALLTLSLIWTAGQRLDTRVFSLFNMQGYPRWLDRFMWLVTQLGNMVSAFIAAFILFMLDNSSLAFEIVFGTLTLWILVEIIKALANRARPFHSLEKTRVIGGREKGDSFPSGHTSQIFFLVTLLIQSYQMGFSTSVILYAIAALVGFTRIYVGAHYPRDVFAGVVLGSVWGLLAILVDRFWVVLYQ